VSSLPSPLGHVLLAAPHQPTRARLARLLEADAATASVTATGNYHPAACGAVDTILAALHGVAVSRKVLAQLAGLHAAPRGSRPAMLVVLTDKTPAPGVLEAMLTAGADGILTYPLPGDPAPRLLTVRQHELLGLLTTGKPDRAVAHGLGIDPTSVKTELRFLYRKLGATTRAGACAAAFRAGLLA
jgi:DNA-binding NarL/FixJ family response regulator